MSVFSCRWFCVGGGVIFFSLLFVFVGDFELKRAADESLMILKRYNHVSHSSSENFSNLRVNRVKLSS